MITCCGVCKKQEDCRPYGTGGTQICFDCMKASPEREKEAVHQFKEQLLAASKVSGAVIIDGIGGTGPMPMPGIGVRQ